MLMCYNIEEMEGVGPRYFELLHAQGIFTTDDLLNRGSTRYGRQVLSKATGISQVLLLQWVNRCDLFRIKGVALQFAELLEGAGVATLKELKSRNACILADRMKDVNGLRHVCSKTPKANVIEQWIEQAKSMQPMVMY